MRVKIQQIETSGKQVDRDIREKFVDVIYNQLVAFENESNERNRCFQNRDKSHGQLFF
jgi:hypothetical protein